MRSRRRILSVIAAALAATVVSGCTPDRFHSSLVTRDAAGTNSANGASGWPVFSPDGSKMAFVSQASNLGPADANGLQDVYVRDLATGVTTLVSVNASGTSGGSDISMNPVFSPDGTKIAFTSYATNLGPADNNIDLDLYVRDLTTGTSSLATINAGGTGSARLGVSGGSRFAFSPDGQDIAFVSASNELVGGPDTQDVANVFVRDLSAGVTTLVSINEANTTAVGGWNPVFRDDTELVFSSVSGALGPADANGVHDIYQRDLASGVVTLLSTDAAGIGAGNASAALPSFSSDGNQMAYTSRATDLGPIVPTNIDHVYLRDLVTGAMTLVSAPAFNASSQVISPDGNRIAYRDSRAQLWERSTGTSKTLAGDSYVWNGDGTRLALVTGAHDLGSTDTNECLNPNGPPFPCPDVYVLNVTDGIYSLVSSRADGADSANQGAFLPRWRPGANQIGFVSVSDNFGDTDSNVAADIYLASVVPPS